jgi:hypothetical protein
VDTLSRRITLARLAAGGAAAALWPTLGRDLAVAQATPTPPEEADAAPNWFVLAGADSRITYLTSDAGARLTYDGPYGSHVLVGAAIHHEASALGRSVTGSLGPFPDQGELWLTLLLPRFAAMTAAEPPVAFRTLAILTWEISTIAGPPRRGALQDYRAVPLEGTAQVLTTAAVAP